VTKRYRNKREFIDATFRRLAGVSRARGRVEEA
jgi:hypothetical protein